MAKAQGPARKRRPRTEDPIARKVARENQRAGKRTPKAPPADAAEVERRLKRRALIVAAQAVADAELLVVERWLTLCEMVEASQQDVLDPDFELPNRLSDIVKQAPASDHPLELPALASAAMSPDIRRWLIEQLDAQSFSARGEALLAVLQLRLCPPSPKLDTMKIGQALGVERGLTISAATAGISDAQRRTFHRYLTLATARDPVLAVFVERKRSARERSARYRALLVRLHRVKRAMRRPSE